MTRVVLWIVVALPVAFDPGTAERFGLTKLTVLMVGALALAMLWIVDAITNTKLPQLTVNKVTDPAIGSGVFNLQIDGATAVDGIGPCQPPALRRQRRALFGTRQARRNLVS